MAAPLKGLVIDKNFGTLDEIEQSLRPEIEFDYFDIVHNFHRALEYHMEMEFHLCFIGEEMPAKDVTSFLRDYDRLAREHPCIFVQFRNKVDYALERNSLNHLGIKAIIAKYATEYDKGLLKEALKNTYSRLEFKEATQGLDAVICQLIQAVDRVAQDRKRGVSTKLFSIYGDHIKDSSKQFGGLYDSYVEKLMDNTEDAAPFKITELEIPEEILALNLPDLTKTSYSGKSNRVWKMLLNKHGKGKEGIFGAAPVGSVTDASSSRTIESDNIEDKPSAEVSAITAPSAKRK